MSKAPLKSAAVLTIHRASDMSNEGRAAIAAWLVKQAEHLTEWGTEYQGRFTARYLYANRDSDSQIP
jgi:hypothetical protein